MIHKLSNDVINKIAAGEVVQRPYNALKQLVQNSIDAGATVIHIKIEAGGLQTLQIKDNGKGIQVEDYPLLCERYATSKIKSVSDLESIDSFGFRGQALASLTHVGDVEVISRHENNKEGYYAKFDKQKLLSKPKPVKRQVGTTITVQNMFSTLASRRKSLIPNEEKKLIKELIYQMALDYPYVEFTLTTQKGQQLLIDYKDTASDEAQLKIFCQFTGMAKQNCLLAATVISSAKITGIFSKINTWDKWRQTFVTINHRIVESPQIQKVIEKAYDEANRTIHKENYSYCCYLNLKINPRMIDCNVHPTKKMVNFYKSGNLFEQIIKWMQKLLQESGTVKYIDTGSRMSQHSLMQLQSKYRQKVSFPQNSYSQNVRNSQNSQISRQSSQQKQPQLQKPEYAFNKTRTDAKQLPLQYFYKNLVSSSSYQKEQNQNQGETKYFVYQGFSEIYQETNKTKQIQDIRNFFLHVTYVGCFNSSHLFIQLQNKLYCFEITHFAKVYVRQALKQKRPLYIKRVNTTQQVISVPEILDEFLSRHRTFVSEEKLEKIYVTTLEQLNFNKDFLEEKYGIVVNEFLEIVSYPIVNKAFENQPLRYDALSYFLMHLFANQLLDHKQDINKLYVEFLAHSFYSADLQQKRYELSPNTDKYDNFFANEMIPTLKMKGKFYEEQFSQVDMLGLVSEMMDLKDAYKMFERC